MNTQTNNKGFSIIEVVLVLAIAALIFLMVFIALPALQRGQANNARKNDASTIASAIGTYRSNSRGGLPTTYASLTEYVDNLSQLNLPATGNIPTGEGTLQSGESDENLDSVQVRLRAKCNDAADAAVAGTNRQAVVLTVVQTSASKYTTVCTDA